MRNYDELDPLSPSFKHGSEPFAAPSSFGIERVLRILTKRRWLIATILAVCLGLAVLATVTMRPVYRATATVELNKSTSPSMDLSDLLSSQLGSSTDLTTDLQTEIAILQGDSLALAVIEKLNLRNREPFLLSASEQKKWALEQNLPLDRAPRTRAHMLRVFHEHLKVDLVHGTRLIQLSFKAYRPDEAAQVANATIDAYKSQYLKTHYDATTATSQWLADQLSELKANVETSQRKLIDFQKKSGIVSLNMLAPATAAGDAGGAASMHSVVLAKLDALNVEATTAEANRIEKEAIYRLVKTGNPDVIMGLSSDPLAVQSKSAVLGNGTGLSALTALREQRGQIEVALAQASAIYGKENRHLQDLQTQMEAVNRQIRQELIEIVHRAEADYKLAQSSEDAIRNQFVKQQHAAQDLNSDAVTLSSLTQEAFSSKKLYEDLYTKLQEANVSAGIKATNITEIDQARPNSEPVMPKPLLFLAAGLLAGLFLGIAAAFTLESLDRTVLDPSEVEQIPGLQVIGAVPEFSPALKSSRSGRNAKRTEAPVAPLGPVILQQPNSAAAEAFRSLRSSILLSRAGGPKSILFTSSIPGEGKSTLAGNLAIAFAQNNKRVALIETDMRRPSLQHVLGVTTPLGLSSVLAGLCSFEDAVQRGVHVPTLDVLLAGPRPPLPSELLESKAFEDLLKRLDADYDFIFLDSPPALLLADAVAISKHVDAVVWVARSGRSTHQFLTRAAQAMRRTRMPCIGVVLNGVNLEDDAYGYTYGYSSYQRYYQTEEA